ncbi:hypothetical protein ACO0LC_04545, partial [Undibacterium sp. JH2W]|uniref:hypothetical protein n=1 Tax=Undibacterium sp. JH2W TaxID=3413037 RepID=UPI003BEF7387
APIQVSPLLPAIPGYIFFSVSLFLLIVYFNKQECPKKSGYLTLVPTNETIANQSTGISITFQRIEGMRIEVVNWKAIA